MTTIIQEDSLPDIGHDTYGDDFVGPPIVPALEERLLALEADHAQALAWLQDMDSGLEALREDARERRNRVARAQARNMGRPDARGLEVEVQRQIQSEAGLDAEES
ncbi:MAG: hypothetical protein FWG38_09020, partial [Defluviitaleaceae bacterium]|nr:hypothetical protein [Defluviitaleaceae bacterium]